MPAPKPPCCGCSTSARGNPAESAIQDLHEVCPAGIVPGNTFIDPGHQKIIIGVLPPIAINARVAGKHRDTNTVKEHSRISHLPDTRERPRDHSNFRYNDM